MKGYYKNWYQHYLELEKVKEQNLQKGYYSNLAKANQAVEQTFTSPKKPQNHNQEFEPIATNLQAEKNFGLLLTLILGAILGVVFLLSFFDTNSLIEIFHNIFAN